MSGAEDTGRSTVHGNVTNLIHVEHAHGDVNLRHAGSGRAHVPQQLPPEPANYENQFAVLESLSAPAPDGPTVHILTGLPGSGKSATALHWANMVTDRFPDGRVYLDLRGHDRDRALDPHEALGFLITSLGGDAATLPTDTAQRAAVWRAISHDRRLLILLDNAVDDEQIRPLLSLGPDTVTLVTSRNAIDLSDVGGVSVRDSQVEPLELDYAVALLRGLVEPRRGPTDEGDLRELARLCGRLQLALRVAGQRLIRSPLLTVAELVEELKEHSGILDPVRRVFESSYRELRADTAALFRLLGMAPGSDISHGSIAALSGGSSRQVRERIDELLTSHLLSIGRPGRYVIHDLLQAYAAELVAMPDHRDEASAALDRLGQWYTSTATACAYALGSEVTPTASATPGFESDRAATEWYGVEEPNLAIMIRSLIDRGLTTRALQLCAITVELYAFHAASPWLDTARTGLALAEAASDITARAWFLEYLGKAQRSRGALDAALTAHQESHALRLQAGDQHGQVRSLNALGLVHLRAGSYEQAEAAFGQCRDLAHTLGDVAFETYAAANLGHVALVRAASAPPADRQAQYQRALDFLDAARAGLDAERQRIYLGNVLHDRAEALIELGRRAEAREGAAAAVTLGRELGNAPLLVPALMVQARVKAAEGDAAGAREDLAEALDRVGTLGDPDAEAAVRARLTALDDTTGTSS
jgi:tetratricopeptide (TPR) repeat protein